MRAFATAPDAGTAVPDIHLKPPGCMTGNACILHVGCVAVITEIEKIDMRESVRQCAKHRQPAMARIEDADHTDADAMGAARWQGHRWADVADAGLSGDLQPHALDHAAVALG